MTAPPSITPQATITASASARTAHVSTSVVSATGSAATKNAPRFTMKRRQRDTSTTTPAHTSTEACDAKNPYSKPMLASRPPRSGNSAGLRKQRNPHAHSSAEPKTTLTLFARIMRPLPSLAHAH